MKLSGAVLLSLILIPLGLPAQGSVYKSGTLVRVQPGDSLQNQLMAAGETVEISGWLANDLLSASKFFMLKGEVSDDALLVGQQVIIDGEVGDLLLSAAETIIINGTIRGDAFLAAREIQITKSGRIEGNAAIAARSIKLEGGKISGWLRAAGAELQMNGTIGGYTEIYSDNVTFGEKYRAGYGTTISSDETIYRENLGVVPADLTLTTKEKPILFIILFKLIFYLSILITGMILLRIFQQTAIDIHRFSTEQFWKNTGVGFLTFLGVPLAIIVLILPVLTIPLSFLLLLVYMLALFIGYLLVAMTLGAMGILYFQGEPKTSTYYWGLALGMIIIAVLTNLPFIGYILNALFLFFGLGSLALYIWMMSSRKDFQSTA